MPYTGQGTQEVPGPRVTRPSNSRAMGLREPPRTGDPVSPWLLFPANSDPASPDLGTRHPGQQRIIFQGREPELARLLIWAFTLPDPLVLFMDCGHAAHGFTLLVPTFPLVKLKGFILPAACLLNPSLKSSLGLLSCFCIYVSVSHPLYYNYYLLVGTRHWP